jgi:hypothetical protein
MFIIYSRKLIKKENKLDRVRQRKMEARAHRQEVLHGSTVENTVIQTPQPKILIKNDAVKIIVKESIKTPVVAEIVKRGPGRPRKMISEKIEKKTKGNLKVKKLVSAKGKK